MTMQSQDMRQVRQGIMPYMSPMTQMLQIHYWIYYIYTIGDSQFRQIMPRVIRSLVETHLKENSYMQWVI